MERDINNQAEENSKFLLALENGIVKATGKAAEGEAGVIIRPGRGVEILLNGTTVTDKAEVRPGDKIEIRTAEETEPDKLEIKISADQMKAEARLIPGIRRTYSLPDQPYTDELTVDGAVHEERIITITPDKMIESLKAEMIGYGIDDSILARLIEEPEVWQVVATGKPAQQGKNGYVEPLFQGEVKSVIYGKDESKVDYRSRFEIEHVNEGDLIARIHPPIAGEAGKTVTGKDIPPAAVYKAEIQCDKGAELSADKKQVKAVSKGVPSYKKGKIHYFRVDDVYSHKGDVDIKSGNVYFHGHLTIQGSVSEGMKVASDGNLEISDNASGAEIMAGGSIIFKSNCIKCDVQAGWVDLVLRDVYKTLAEMNESLIRAIEASEAVAKALEQKGKHSEQMEAAVVRALLQSKFTDLPEYSVSLLKNLKEAGRSLPGELVRTIKDIVPHFVDFQYSQSLSRPVLVKVKDKLSMVQGSRQDESKTADISAPYVQNSTMTCTGNIVIGGTGVYNTRLKCGGTVNIERLFRGGSIEAGGDVYIGEAGTPRITADQGLIQVPYNGKVHLGSVYENIRVRFGTTEYRCEKNLNNVRLVLDQQEFEVKILHWEK